MCGEIAAHDVERVDDVVQLNWMHNHSSTSPSFESVNQIISMYCMPFSLQSSIFVEICRVKHACDLVTDTVHSSNE